MKQWKCTVCGYIHHGEEPPETCPVCGADKSQFVLMEEETAPDALPSGPVDATGSEETGKRSARGPSLLRKEPWSRISQQVTHLHGHPIAVHIPNGLLPIATFFTFIALLFGSEGFAIAARYNTTMVALAMPAVIATGWIDWINRFGGKMTRVFEVKMACAGIVTFLSFILTIWWWLRPELYLHGISGNAFFAVVTLLNLVAAGIAGWYGGKLVFNK